MNWMIGRNFFLNTYNKIYIFRQILKPVKVYGCQLWGCVETSNIDIVQRFQNKVLSNVGDAPWYIKNSDLHPDLGGETVD